MNVASIIEMINVPPSGTRLVGAAQVPDQSPRTFSESLRAVSKASSETNTTSDASTKAGRRQKSSSEDAKTLATVAHVHAVPQPPPSQPPLPQQAVVAQQSPSINLVLIPMRQLATGSGASPDASTVAISQPMRDASATRLLGIASNISQPAVVQSGSTSSSQAQKESDPPQAASMLPWPTIQSTKASVVPASQTATNLSNPVVNQASNKLTTVVPNDPSDPAASVVANAFPSVVTETVASAAPGVVSAAAHNAMSTAVPVAVAKGVPGEVAKPIQNSTPTIVSDAMPNAIPNPPPVPVLHATANASAKGDATPRSSPASTSNANPPVAAPEPGLFATDLNAPGATANQLAALIQPAGGLPATGQAGVPSVSSLPVIKTSVVADANGKDGPNNAVNDATGLKQHAQSAPDQAGSQDTASSGDQTQGSASPAGPKRSAASD